MKSRRLLCCGAAMAAAIALAACGGGGNSAPSAPATNSGVGAGGAAGGSGTGSASGSITPTQRTRFIGSGLSLIGGSVNINSLTSPGGSVFFGLQQALSIRGLVGLLAAGSPMCYNGVEDTWSPSSGAFNTTLEIFYDSACADPYELQTLSITPPSGSSGTGTANGTEEVWNSSGSPVSYKTDSYTFTIANNQVTQVTQQRSAAPAPGVSPSAQYGYSCVFTNGQPVDCGMGNVTNVASVSESVGFAETSTSSSVSSASPTPFPSGSPSPSPSGSPSPSPSATAVPLSNANALQQANAMQLTIAGMGYTGTLGGLTLAPGTAPAWSITGGTQAVTLNGTVSEGFSRSGLLSNTNLTLTDSSDGLSVTLTASHGGRLTGSIKNSSGQSQGTISLDLSGSGQVSYSDGTTAQVKDWVIL